MLRWKAELRPWVDPMALRNFLQNFTVNWTPLSEIIWWRTPCSLYICFMNILANFLAEGRPVQAVGLLRE